MARYILKRIILIPFMLLIISFIIYVLVNLVQTNPALLILGTDASEEAVAQLTEEMGFNKPLIVRYVQYIGNALRGDFGQSYFTKSPVIDEILVRLPYTLKLTFGVIGLSILIGLPLGILCAVKQYSFVDNFCSVVAMFSAAMPNFWMSLLLLLLFSQKLGWFPAAGITGWRSWVLPIVTLAITNTSNFLRYARSSMLDTVRQDYVITARAKGNAESVVILKHAFRNALLPLITISGLLIGSLMSSAVVVESVFSIPGLGLLVLNAIKQKDIPLVMAAILFLAMIFLFITLIMDVLYACADPRIKASYMQHTRKRKKITAPSGQEG